MIKRVLRSGEPVKIKSEEEFNNIRDGYPGYGSYIGSYEGPGMYLTVFYQRYDTCGCCHENVLEIIWNETAVQELENEALELSAELDDLALLIEELEI